MGAHDFYGKAVMRAAAGASFVDSGTQVHVDYVAGGARIDGAVAGTVAVEIESRTPKQVRGAVLDLLCHPFRKKLLVLVPAHMAPAQTEIQCGAFFRRFGISDADFRVVVLMGTGDTYRLDEDAAIVRQALAELGVPESFLRRISTETVS